MLIRGVHNVYAATATIELHEPIDQGEERIVAALPDPVAGLEDRANLPHDDVSGPDLLTAKSLHAATLSVGVPPVAA